jgi:hypothetical protein
VPHRRLLTAERQTIGNCAREGRGRASPNRDGAARRAPAPQLRRAGARPGRGADRWAAAQGGCDGALRHQRRLHARVSFNAAAVERPRRSPWRRALGQVPGVTLRATDGSRDAMHAVARSRTTSTAWPGVTTARATAPRTGTRRAPTSATRCAAGSSSPSGETFAAFAAPSRGFPLPALEFLRVRTSLRPPLTFSRSVCRDQCGEVARACAQ